MSLITIDAGDAHIAINIRPPVSAMLDSTETLALAVTTTANPVSAPAARWVKILPDGTRLPAGSDRTDHVAVIDTHSGWMYAVESLGDPSDADDGISQQACVDRCSSLRLLGFDDWSLPTREQLIAIIDDTRHEPCVDTSVFPRVKRRWHWTSSSSAWSSASAWLVGFSYGYVDGFHRDGVGFALAVRRAGQ